MADLYPGVDRLPDVAGRARSYDQPGKFGEEALSDLLAHYEKAGGRVWPRIVDHIAETMAASPLQIAAFALRSGLEEYMEMARATLGVDENRNEIAQE